LTIFILEFWQQASYVKCHHHHETVPLYPALTAWRRAYHIVSNLTLDVYGDRRNEENISYIPDISVY